MSSPKSTNITWHAASVTAEDRRRLLGQTGCVVWFTGLSGSGKSTVARQVEEKLVARGHAAYLLDGDNLRHGLNADLGFDPADRRENIRRVGAVAQLIADAGLVCLSAFISPYAADRRVARERLPPGRFVEVHVDTPIEECERRDPKGLYAKARAGHIPDFTGISAPYERPEAPEIRLQTVGRPLEDCAEEVVGWLAAHDLLAVAGG